MTKNDKNDRKSKKIKENDKKPQELIKWSGHVTQND